MSQPLCQALRSQIQCLLGLHLLGSISLGIAYPSGATENPKDIMTCAPMSLLTLCEPGAMAAPMKDRKIVPTISSLRIWKTSDTDDRSGASTACGKLNEFNIQVWRFEASRLAPIYDICSQVSKWSCCRAEYYLRLPLAIEVRRQ